MTQCEWGHRPNETDNRLRREGKRKFEDEDQWVNCTAPAELRMRASLLGSEIDSRVCGEHATQLKKRHKGQVFQEERIK